MKTNFSSPILIIFVLAGLFFLPGITLAANPTVIWDNILSASTDAEDIALDLAGNVYTEGGWSSFATSKYDSAGNLIWNRQAHNTPTDYGYGQGIGVDSAGNVYAGGYASVSGNPFNVSLIKYDSAGNLIWSRRYVSASWDYGGKVAVDSTGNYIYVTGNNPYDANPDFHTIKYDSAGNVVWNKTYDSGFKDSTSKVAVDSTGNYVYVTGTSFNSSGNRDFRTIKYDSAGNIIWNKTYDNGFNDYGSDIVVDSTGNYIYVAGTSYNSSSNRDFRTIKYDSAGNIIWNKTYDAGKWGRGKSIAVDLVGNVYAIGLYYQAVGAAAYHTIKYDSAGNLIWSVPYNACDCVYLTCDVTVDLEGNIYTEVLSSNHHLVKYSQPPIAANLMITPPATASLCAGGAAYGFSWNYYDSGSSQSKFQIQVDNDSDFSSPTVDRTFFGLNDPDGFVDTQQILLTSDPDAPASDKLSYGTTYFWRVQVWDSHNTPSDWFYPSSPPGSPTAPAGESFSPPPHAYPTVDFTCSPDLGNSCPSVHSLLERITFEDNSIAFGGASISSQHWDFCKDDICTDQFGSGSPVEHKYNVKKSYIVELTVEDTNGFSCSAQKTINISAARVKWKEVLPK